MNQRLLSAVVTMSLMACGGEVLVDGGSPCTDRPDTHTQQQVDLRVASPGTFVGDRLHLDAYVDGRRSYVVLEIAAGATFLVAEPALDGPTELTRVADDLYARAATDSQATVRLELIDTRAPLDPVISASRSLDGVMPASFEAVLGTNDGHAYFCLASERNAGAALVSVDLDDLTGAPTPLDTFACHEHAELESHAVSKGEVWVRWAPGEDDWASQIDSYGLSPNEVRAGVSFGYNPDGVHHYGRALAAATDGSRIVVDPADEHWMLVFDGFGQIATGPYARFPLPGAKRLLAVDAQLAYYATSEGLRAVDVSDAPILFDGFHAETSLAPSEVSLVAIGDRYIAFTDGSARLFVAERSANGPVAPAPTFVGPARENPGGC